MAEQSSQNVVNQAQSMGDRSSIDVSGTFHSSNALSGGAEEAVADFEETTTSNAHTHFTSEDTASREMADTMTSGKQDGVDDLTVSARGVVHFIHANTEPTEARSEEQLPSTTESREHLVNGDSGSNDGSDDTGYQNSASEDVIDQGKTEGMEQNLETGIGQERASSVKKPISFKPVSVTKNFLAKTGTAATATVKAPIDKAAPSSQTIAAAALQGPKPRLVAKSGRDARSASLRIGVSGGGGPDASKVWNRNKPAPPPVPKQFTDEELKQQYGIHLATRLQADESGKDSKWADIDDDEDDWAPETVEWMDGTKSTIASTDNQPGQTPDMAAQLLKASEDASKDPAAASRLSSISSLGKTILRPGARLVAQTRPGLVLKSVPENQLTSEKPATPAAAKSPWAPLPPIDKVSPISFQPPPTSSPKPTSALPREMPPPEGPGSLPSPAREIAADDFNRSWRDGERSSRELFNSQSGRYEPVKAPPPRKLVRQESEFRAPAVLQRPAPAGQIAQAEPSAGFQHQHPHQRGVAQQDGRSWPRTRRDSSSMGDRSASERVSEQGDARVSPTQQLKEINRTHSPATSQFDRVSSPNPSSVDSTAPVAAPPSYHARGADRTQPPATEPSAQDVRAVQQQLMKERIELNRKRKQEEEAKEEAARKERIRIRMEALGPPASVPKDTSIDEKSALQDSKMSQAQSIVQNETLDESVQEHKPIADIDKATDRSRVAGTPPEKTISAPTAVTPLEEKSPQPNVISPPISEPSASNRPHLTSTRSPKFGATHPSKSLSDTNVSAASHEVQQLPGLGQAPPPDRAVQSWGNIPHGTDHAMSWGASSGRAVLAGNVWGPPSHDRPLGNGAFENDFQRIPSMQRQHQPGPQHPPPNSLPQRPSNISPSAPFDNNSVVPNQAFSKSHAEHLPISQNPISPPMSTHPFPQTKAQLPNSIGSETQRPAEQLQAVKRGWKDFHLVAAKQDAEAYERARAEASQTEFQPTFVETFRQTVPGDRPGRRQVLAVTKDVRDSRSDANEKPDINDASISNSVTTTNPPQPISQASVAQPIVNGRASRFFGPGVDRGNTIPVAPPPVLETNSPEIDIVEPESSRPASPPPPESETHPAYGRTSHPLVHLPMPAPKVKLPPMPSPPPVVVRPASPPQEPVIMPTRFRTGPQPIVNQAAWQDRFNGLFNRATRTQPSAVTKASTPPPTQSPVIQTLAVEISSKAAFDVTFVPESTTVSLPQGLELVKEVPAQTSQASLPDDHFESKPTEDELMDEEREFGSSPTVRLPHAEYENAETMPVAPPLRYASKFVQAELNGEFVSSTQSLSFEDLDAEHKVKNGVRIIIRILGREFEAKILLDKIQNDTARRASKVSRNKKRTITGKIVPGGSTNSQSPQSVTPRSEATFTEKSSPQPDVERRNSGWAKTPKPARSARSNNNSNNNASNIPNALAISPSANKPQNATSESAIAAPRPQVSRSGWAKPPKGKPSQGLGSNRI